MNKYILQRNNWIFCQAQTKLKLSLLLAELALFPFNPTTRPYPGKYQSLNLWAYISAIFHRIELKFGMMTL